ncbi:MAG: hypothetical protein LBQ58_01975 [Synergistaceae bacterium]|nr:hypothetical protein [Synergistaceae bacterium]
MEVVTTYTDHRYLLAAGEDVPPPRAVYGDTLKALIIVLSRIASSLYSIRIPPELSSRIEKVTYSTNILSVE